MSHSLAIIIPAYNEEKSISNVVNDVLATSLYKEFQVSVIVVNDCSTDATALIINSLNCVSLHLPVNLGIGGAMQTGFKYALENDFDYAVQVDGDGQHPSVEIPTLVSELIKYNLDIIIGSRFITHKGFQSSFIRRAGIVWFSLLLKILTGQRIYDCTSGFRVLNRKSLELVCETYPDEYPEPESIILFAKNKIKIGELPVSMSERQGGVSSIGFFSSIYYMWKVTLGIIFTFIRTNNR